MLMSLTVKIRHCHCRFHCVCVVLSSKTIGGEVTRPDGPWPTNVLAPVGCSCLWPAQF